MMCVHDVDPALLRHDLKDYNQRVIDVVKCYLFGVRVGILGV